MRHGSYLKLKDPMWGPEAEGIVRRLSPGPSQPLLGLEKVVKLVARAHNLAVVTTKPGNGVRLGSGAYLGPGCALSPGPRNTAGCTHSRACSCPRGTWVPGPSGCASPGGSRYSHCGLASLAGLGSLDGLAPLGPKRKRAPFSCCEPPGYQGRGQHPSLFRKPSPFSPRRLGLRLSRPKSLKTSMSSGRQQTNPDVTQHVEEGPESSGHRDTLWGEPGA